MDSLTQFALGAAIGEAMLGRKAGNRGAVWGGIIATLPDLDVFVPLGDAVSDFTYHRSASHSLLVLAAATPLVAWIMGLIHSDLQAFRTRLIALVYMVFATHVLLDSFTTYGTQIFWPISNVPISWSTIFIIDPLYTLPLLIGVVAALALTRANNRGHLMNRVGLIASSIYLVWTTIAKNHVDHRFEEELTRQGIRHQDIFTTPTPFNSLLWRAVVTDEGGYYEAYYSIFDARSEIRFRRYVSDEHILRGMQDHWPVQRLKWFSRGFYSVSLQQQDIIISDLRMGAEPNYVFRFKVGEIRNPHGYPTRPEQLPTAINLDILGLIWRRIWDLSVEFPA